MPCCMQVWRPIIAPIDDSPLAMVDASTVAPEDLLDYAIHFPGEACSSVAPGSRTCATYILNEYPLAPVVQLRPGFRTVGTDAALPARLSCIKIAIPAWRQGGPAPNLNAPLHV